MFHVMWAKCRTESQNNDSNKSFESVAGFKYLGVMLTKGNCAWRNHKQIKLRVCLLPFSPEPFVFHLLTKNIKIKMYTSIILPVLQGCELRLTHWGTNKGWVFKSMVLRKILGPRREEVAGDWRKFHNGELCDLCSSPNIIRVISRMRWVTRDMYGGEQRNIQGLGRETLGKETTWKT